MCGPIAFAGVVKPMGPRKHHLHKQPGYGVLASESEHMQSASVRDDSSMPLGQDIWPTVKAVSQGCVCQAAGRMISQWFPCNIVAAAVTSSSVPSAHAPFLQIQ